MILRNSRLILSRQMIARERVVQLYSLEIESIKYSALVHIDESLNMTTCFKEVRRRQEPDDQHNGNWNANRVGSSQGKSP